MPSNVEALPARALRTLFFGTSAFAVPSLEVTAHRCDLAGVVTQPDRPAGRGHRLVASPVKERARQLGVAVYEPDDLTAFAARATQRSFDLFVLASYGRILPGALLAVPRLGALNVHPSLLPRYRGATPIQTALRNGDSETGVTIMLMDAGMDTGPVVVQRAVSIDRGETYGELHDRLAHAGAELLDDAFAFAYAGDVPAVPQTGTSSVTRAIRTPDLVIDWSWTPQKIVDFVRAYAPQPAARAEFAGELLKFLRAHLDERGALVVDELIAPNRGRMSGTAYLQGRAWPQS